MAQAASPALPPHALPTGGLVKSGAAVISAPSATQLTVSQSSAKAIITWNSFSIGQGGTVQFNNGSGSTLNRVTGVQTSNIDGLLSATGSVYLVNPNGVVIGKTGVVNTGGTFVASTLDVADSQFLAGGDLTFTGSSTASVINYGKIGSLGGDVALIAAKVDNEGEIDAAQGAAGLAAGYQVTLSDGALNGGKFAVLVGDATTAVSNSGLIQAAEVELRSNGGNIYALSGNDTGVIRATGVAAGGGSVYLVADNGALTVGGSITARAADGSGGGIETSGSDVTIGAAKIDAGQGGSWLLDPNDLTIDQTAANTIAASLNAGTSVTQQTTPSQAGGPSSIVVSPNVTINWATRAGLTLSSFRDIDLGADVAITSTAGGAVTLQADNTGTGIGTVNFGAGAKISTTGAVTLFYNPSVNPAGSGVNATSYVSPTENYAANVTAGAPLTAYMLVNSIDDLQNVRNNLSGTYAQGRDIDAAETLTWNAGAGFSPIGGGASPAFAGTFNGQGHLITNLVIDRPNQAYVGLFGALMVATLENVDLNLGSVTGGAQVGGLAGFATNAIVRQSSSSAAVNAGASGDDVGGLIGAANFVQLSNSYASGSVNGAANVGGLVGRLGLGAVTQSYTTGSVYGSSYVGGLVGDNQDGSVGQSYATGAVNAGDGATYVGGLVGAMDTDNPTFIRDSYASGPVTVGANARYVGGLVGNDYGGAVFQAYALGAVTTGANAIDVGGLVGAVGIEADGSLNQTYSTGLVSTGAGSTHVGGLVGVDNNGIVVSTSNSYWDVATSGQTTSAGGVGLTTAQAFNTATYSGFSFATTPGAAGWVIVDGDGTLNNAGGAAGATRPLLLSEWSSTIVNAHQLQLVTLNLAASYLVASNIDATATSGFNAAGIWSTTGFAPIGTFSTPFTGAFNGQDYLIASLNINRPSALFVGLFSTTNNASLQNIYLFGGQITGALNVGAVVGYAQGGAITGSTAFTTVTGGANSANIGGMVGYNLGDTMTNDYAFGSVTAGSGANTVGGLVGSSNYGVITLSASDAAVSAGYGAQAIGGLVGASHSSTISHSSAAGAVTGADTAHNIGGLVGLLDDPANSGSTIVSSYASGAVTFGAQAVHVGGLVGNDLGGSISQGVDFGSVSGTGTGAEDVGGLVGGIGGGVINASYATGAVNGGTSAEQVGGLVGGVLQASVTSSYATGAVTGAGASQFIGGLVGDDRGAVTLSYATGAVSGGANAFAVGGLIGSVEQGGSLGQSYATGAVTGGAGGQDLGGLVGMTNGGALITQAYAQGPVTGGAGASNLGGLIGQSADSTISQTYAIGMVSAGYGASNLGGLIGANATANVTSSYWDTETSGLTHSAAGVGQTTAQLTAALPAGFSPTVWGQVAGLSFPYLLFQYPGTTPDVISGEVYGGASNSVYPLATVDALSNGAPIGQAITGANGYYQILAPRGAVQTTHILTYVTGPLTGEAYEDGVAGPGDFLYLKVGFLTAQTAATSLSGFAAGLAQAIGSQISPSLVATAPAGALSFNPGAGLYLTADGGFTVDQPLSLTGTLQLVASGGIAENQAISGQTVTLYSSGGGISLGAPLTASSAAYITANGSVTEWGAGAITAPGLAGGANGVVWLGGANQIGTLQSFVNNGAGGFGLLDNSPLSVTFGLSVGSGALWLTDTSAGGVSFNGAITGGGTGYIASQGAIVFNSAMTLGGALQIYSNSGGVSETALGSIGAASLTGSTVSGLNLGGTNHIAVLAGFADFGSGIIFNDAQALTVTGDVTSYASPISLTDTAAGGITLKAKLKTPAQVTLVATTGALTEAAGGAIVTGTLNATASTGINLGGPNTIAHIGVDTTASGPNIINH